MKRELTKSITLLIAVIMMLCFPISAYAEFHYKHNPMENPKAAEDIIVNPDAVYGYSPNPESKRLGSYASYE